MILNAFWRSKGLKSWVQRREKRETRQGGTVPFLSSLSTTIRVPAKFEVWHVSIRVWASTNAQSIQHEVYSRDGSLIRINTAQGWSSSTFCLFVPLFAQTPFATGFRRCQTVSRQFPAPVASVPPHTFIWGHSEPSSSSRCPRIQEGEWKLIMISTYRNSKSKLHFWKESKARTGASTPTNFNLLMLLFMYCIV